jgi:hypothetical protein
VRVGASQLTVIPLANEIFMTDWIFDVRMLQSAAGGDFAWEIAVGYAHNRVELWRVESTGGVDVVAKAYCSERSLLYSMRLTGETRSSLRAFGGTVFSDVLLWQPFAEDEKMSEEKKGEEGTCCAVQERLQGHDGVVFHLSTNADGALCSVSDDRTVRVW